MVNELDEELSALLGGCAAGDDASFTRLSERYAPLIHAMSARFARSFAAVPGGSGEQELCQEARLALYRASLTFDREQDGVEFGLYARICIRNALVSLLRREQAAARARQRAEAAAIQVVHDPLQIAAEADAAALRGMILAELSPYEREIFEQYISGRSVRSIALSVEKPERSVHNALYRIRAKIKGLLEKTKERY